jgi:hypothetical protein
MKLHEALLGCSTAQLRRVAEAWGATLELGTLRHEFADALTPALAAGAAGDDFWNGLDGHARRVLQTLVRAHGRHDVDFLIRRVAGSRGAEPDEAAREIEQQVGRLIELGLVFRVFEAEHGLRRTVLVLPDEVVDALRPRLPSHASASPGLGAIEPGQAAHGDVAHDLFVLASALRREAQAANSRGLAGRRARTVAQVLGSLHAQVPDGPGEPARRWQFLLWIGKRLGWFAAGSWPLPDDDRIGLLLGDRLAIAREVLGGSRADAASNRSGEYGLDLGQLQADALQIMSEISPQVWWPADALAGHIGQQLGLDWSGETGSHVPGPARKARAALLRWLGARWHWLGLIDWGHTDDGWSVVAVNPLVAELIGGQVGPGRGEAGPCQIGEGFQLLAPAAADFPTLYRCERYLAYRGGDVDERRYDVTPASVARGIRLGGDEDELLAGLARLLQRDVPTSWVEVIVGWCRAKSALRVEPRILLVASDEAALSAALDVDDARQAVANRLGARYGLVAPGRLPELLTGLAAAGLPVEVDPALRVEPRRPGQAAALGGGVTESAWVALDVLRRLGAEAIADQRDLAAAQRALEASLSTQALETLERRARTIAALVSERRGNSQRRPQRRKRVV